MNQSRRNFSIPILAWTVRAVVLGLLVGPVISLLTFLVAQAGSIRTTHPWLHFLMPLGALLTALLYQKLGPYLRDGGSQVIDLINQGILDIAHPTSIGYEMDRDAHKQKISTKMAPLLLFNTFITHLVGASGGKEGVGVQIGASIGSYCSRLEMRMLGQRQSIQQKGIWLISGAGAAFGALFNAPIAGTLFGMQFSNPRVNRTDALLPCLTASFTACMASQALHTHTLVPVTAEAFALDLPTLLILLAYSILLGFASRLFCHLIHLTKSLFSRLTSNPYKKALIAGSLLLLASIVIYLVTGTFAYNGLSLNLIIEAEYGNTSKFAPLFKLLLTALTIGSGFVGGEVIPILVIGATTGALFGTLLPIPVSALSMFGAIGMLSGSTKLPLACFVLGLELYGFGNPTSLFFVCSIAYLFSGRLSIYERQIVPQIIDPDWDV
ncbi:MAG: chloride channel protein [Spirochaetales bacterium]|nr:chloride channel protein [Spirochaetales bacterium]